MKKLAIGIMSGTSLDGIDIALLHIDGVQEKTNINFIYGDTIPYKQQTINAIEKCLRPDTTSSSIISSLHTELAYEYKDAVLNVLKQTKYSIQDIDFIACHGQTIIHIPNSSDSMYQSSLQLGDGSILANLLQVPVVSNFRSADIAVGGQGAPLVPFVDYILYNDKNKTRVMHNIGGISNVTILPNNCMVNEVYAFDTGPGNMMMNIAMRHLYNQEYDKDGLHAKQGVIIPDLLQELQNNPYLMQVPPKSTGRIDFGEEYTISLIKKYANHPKVNYIKTFLEYAIMTMVSAYQNWIFTEHKVDEVIVSGGGAHHPIIMKELQKKLKIPVLRLDAVGGSIDFKEAIAFAILGHHTLLHEPSNLPSATNASRRVILGQVSYVK